MRIGNYRFSPPWWGIALTVVGVIVLSLLGNWQINRAHQKEALDAAQAQARGAGPQRLDIARADIAAHRQGVKHGYDVVARGRFDSDHQILLADQVEGTRNGYRVWTPLVLSSGVRVMVDRGWVAKDDSGSGALPNPSLSQDETTVHGHWEAFPQPGIRLGARTVCDKKSWPRLLSYPDTHTVRCQYRAPVADGLLKLSPDADNGFSRDASADTGGLSPFAHYAYASQWFLMALVAIVIFIVVNTRRDPK